MRTQKPTLGLLLLLACSGCLDAPGAGKIGHLDSAQVVCPGGPTVSGIDVSEWQGNINWAAAAQGHAFAIARINDGHHVDPYFQTNWAQMKANGLIRGAYQFYEPTMDPVEQANIGIAAVGQLGDGDLPVTLDVEWTSGTPTVQSIQAWIDTITAGTGKYPIIYTASGYWNQYFNGQFGNIDLWVANWSVNCPALPDSWSGWRFWQTGGGPVNGIGGNVDWDVFNGTLQDLQYFANGNAADGCTNGNRSDCGHFGCGCVDGQCNGGFCPGTGCSQGHTNACGMFGCGCADGQCNGGFCPGTGCTAKEANDCGNFGCNCVDHMCGGGFCPGQGCTAKELNDCGNFGCGCVDHKCNGGFCPGSGCTAKQALDCKNNNQDCAGGKCVDQPKQPEPDDGGMPKEPPAADAGTKPAQVDMGHAGKMGDAGAPPKNEPMGGDGGVAPMTMTSDVQGGCSVSGGRSSSVTGLALILLALLASRRRRWE
jgi:MYXO-CTERM domain-containing protein